MRREADVAAFEKRRKAEEDAEHEFILATRAAAPRRPSTDAQRSRAEKLEKAKKEFDAALAAAQEQFRIVEGRGAGRRKPRLARCRSRLLDRDRVSESSSKAARATAEQALAKALARYPKQRRRLRSGAQATSTILADYKRAENEEFERFHKEVQALRG